MTKYTRDVQCAPADSLYTIHNVINSARYARPLIVMHNAVNRGMRKRTMLNYMRGHYTLIYFHIHNICARICTLMDKIFAYPQYVCVCVCGYNVNTARVYCVVICFTLLQCTLYSVH